MAVFAGAGGVAPGSKGLDMGADIVYPGAADYSFQRNVEHEVENTALA